jgi:hypothetical protein
MSLLDYDPAHFVCGTAMPSIGRTIEGHKFFGRFTPEGSRNSSPLIVSATDHGGGKSFNDKILDTSWLEAASRTYNISNKVSDFILNDVPIVTTPLPNKNMQAFSYRELMSFDPMLHNLVYKTFKRSAMHFEHENRDPTKAKGVIFDVVFVPIPKYNIGKVSILIGCDRTKDPDLANYYKSIQDILNTPNAQLMKTTQLKEQAVVDLKVQLMSSRIQEADHWLLARGVTPKTQTVAIRGSFVITGTLSQSRQAIVSRLERDGYTTTSSVNKTTIALIYGDAPSQSKVNRAIRLNIPRWTETELTEYLNATHAIN